MDLVSNILSGYEISANGGDGPPSPVILSLPTCASLAFESVPRAVADAPGRPVLVSCLNLSFRRQIENGRKALRPPIRSFKPHGLSACLGAAPWSVFQGSLTFLRQLA